MSNYREFSEAEIDQILQEVERSLSEANALIKSKNSPAKKAKKEELVPEEAFEEEKKDKEKEEDKEDKEEEAKKEEKKDIEEDEEKEKEEKEKEEKYEKAQPEEEPKLEEPKSSEEPALSEDEIKEIYQAIDPREFYAALTPEQLEGHFIVLREFLEKLYQKPSESQELPKQPELSQKSEDTIIKQLQEENKQLRDETTQIKKSLDLIAKAIEIGFTPQRKSIEGVSFIQKSSFDESNQQWDKQTLDNNLRAFYQDKNKVASLSKSDRDVIDSYVLRGVNRDKVEKILRGGK